MIRLAPVILGVAMALIAPATSASGPAPVPVKTTISIQPPQWARKGLTGVTFVGKVSGGPGCTMGRRVGLYQDPSIRLGCLEAGRSLPSSEPARGRVTARAIGRLP
jgi:hypothetical protein